MKATSRQRRAAAALIARTAEPIEFDEASRLISELKREQMAFPDLLEKIIEADQAGDVDRLGRLLRRAKASVRQGDWLPLLRRLCIHPRRAQRLTARSTDRERS